MNIQINKFYAVGLISIVLGISFSCSQDLGNYDYHDINEVSISFDSPSYSVMQGMPIKIVPKLSFSMDETGDTANYSYEWMTHRYIATNDQYAIISTERNLDLQKPSIANGSYTVYYKVTDNNTGITWTNNFSLKISSPIYEGWLALCNNGGKSRLDMVSKINGKDTVINDVLTSVGANIPDKYINAAPFEIQAHSSGKGFYGIYLITEGGCTRVDEESFMWDETYDIINEFDVQPANNFLSNHISYVNSYSMYLHDTSGNIYYYGRMASTNYSMPINTLNLLDYFKVSKYVCGNTWSANPSFLYDETNQRFLKHYTDMMQSSKCQEITNGDVLTSWNTAKDLVYMDKQGGNRDGTITAILKDPRSNKFYVLRFAGAATPKQTKYEELDINNFQGIFNFDQIEHYAVHNSLPYLFYSIGGKVYEYDMELKQSFLMLELANKEITILDFADQAYLNEYYDKLQVCSYDKSAGGNSGIMEFYSVGQVNGPLTSIEKHQGLGRIVSTDYRTR
ncbi:MAG: PKD-like family lipoprotein [Bacteroidales bacterium]